MEFENQKLKAESQVKDEKIVDITKQFENSQNNEKDLKRKLDEANQEINNLKKQRSLKVFDGETLNMAANPKIDLSKYGSFPNLKNLIISLNKLPDILRNKSDLSKITYLDIYKADEYFSATQLPNLFQLASNTETLNLLECDLTSLPKEVGNLKNLRKLKVCFNKLTSLPKEIGNLQELKYLDLISNNLTELPKEIGNLKNLRGLNVSFNGLTSLPKEIGNLQELKSLYLSGNQLSELPAEIYSLPKLEELYLKYNPLNKLSKKYFASSHVEIDQ